MNRTGQKVAIITGGSQGIGAALVAAYRGQGWSVVATARRMKPTEDPDVLTIDGDITQPGTADRIAGGALDRFGRIDTLVNNAGVYISKPFTDYTAEDYARMVGVNLSGFFWLTQRAGDPAYRRRPDRRSLTERRLVFLVAQRIDLSGIVSGVLLRTVSPVASSTRLARSANAASPIVTSI